ncbi:MAG: hypothetical protein IJ594_01110 [Oscillospiraceae bacterium]|nr:hypothetical protein [Oscillospiraceae bacterium]
MYSDVQNGKRSRLIWLGFLLAILLLLFFALRGKPGRDLSEESAAAIQAAVQRSARQCYVVEGVYPPNLEYLEENYGLQINTEDFYVSYEAFASNLPPNVRVTSKG